MPNPFYVDPTQGYDPNALSGLGQALRVNRLEREQVEAGKVAEEKQVAMQTEIQTAINSGKPGQVAEVMGRYPEASKGINDAFGLVNDEKKGRMSLFQRQLMSANAEDVAGMYERRIAEIEAMGGDASQTKEGLADWLSHQDIEKERKDAGILLELSNPEAYKQFAKEQEGAEKGGGIGTVSPKDFTVESLSAYSESGDVKDLVRYAPQVKEIAGIPHQYNQSTLKWEPLIDLNDSRISEQAKAQANIDADTQSRLDFGKDKSEFQKGESKLLTKISSARSKQEVMVNTAGEIKNLMSGWNTKYGASLSSIPGSEARKLKGLINTLKANSAFTTLADLKESGGTLGAISAPELTLLEAAMGTIDQGGDIPEQLRVIDQILNANESAITRLDNAYAMDKRRYSGTYDEALAVSEQAAPPKQEVSEHNQALEWANANPNDPRAQKILSIQRK